MAKRSCHAVTDRVADFLRKLPVLKGKRILLAKAVDGLALPLHAGAEKFYREIGMSLDSVMLPG